jgi:hypothetical protein
MFYSQSEIVNGLTYYHYLVSYFPFALSLPPFRFPLLLILI